MFIQMQITTGLMVVNVLLLFALMWLNVQSYRTLKAEYTLFTLIFVGLFLLHNLFGAYFMLTTMDFYVMELATHAMILTGLQTAAFAGLLWMQRQ